MGGSNSTKNKLYYYKIRYSMSRKRRRGSLGQYGVYGQSGGFAKRRRVRLAATRYIPFIPAPPTANAKATRALQLIRKFKRDEEVKYLQSMADTAQIPIGGNWIVNGFGPYCSQGTTVTTRIGNKVSIKDLTVRGLIKLTALEATGTSVRVIFVYDRKPAGADAASSDVFTTDNQLNSGYNILGASKGRFQIFFDRTYSFSSVATQRSFKMYTQKTFPIVYNGNAGTVADLQRGNLLMMAMAEGNAAAINVDFGWRIRFTDA